MNEPRLAELHQHYLSALERVSALGESASVERVGPWLGVDAGLGVSKFNVAAVAAPIANPRAALREAMEWATLRGINLRLDLRGSADRALLAASLVEGFSFWRREPAMLLEPLPPPHPGPSSFEIRSVSTPTDLALYSAADAEEYSDADYQLGMAEKAVGLDGVTLFVALEDGGRAIGRSMALAVGSLVGIHNVYVAPSCRGLGLGTAITAVAIEAGRRQGADAAALQATVEAFAMYQRMGFRHVDDYVVVGTDGPPAS